MLPTPSNVSEGDGDKCGSQHDAKTPNEDEDEPTTSSRTTNYLPVLIQSPSSINSMVPQCSNTSFYDGRMLTPPDLPSDEELTCYNPNQPRYCICNQISYGDMIACDNNSCPYEWFHFPCVGIIRAPKGKWFCPLCTASMRNSGKRKRKYS